MLNRGADKTTIARELGPTEHDRPMTLAEFEASDFAEGYKYELIAGRLYVTCEPDLSEDWVEKWLFRRVLFYSLERSNVINFVTDKARVFVPGRLATVPEPDLAAYHDFPIHLPIGVMRWQDVSPLLVGEVLSPNDPHKDLIRNVQLYLRVPSIREYWLVDGRKDPDRPTMRVHRRHRNHWRTIDLVYGDVYTTRLLPGFRLVIDPRK